MRNPAWMVLGIVAATGLVAVAEEGLSGGAGLAGVRQELGLSDAQIDQLHKLRTEEKKASVRRRADLRVARIELRELLAAPSVDEKAVDAKVKEISDLQAASLKARVKSRLALRQVLTPEQREALRHRRSKHARPGRRDHASDGAQGTGTPSGGEDPGDEDVR